MSGMKETETYTDIGNRFKQNIKSLQPGWEVTFSQDKFLPQMIAEIEHDLGGETDYHGQYIPNLKLDIVLGIKKSSKSSHISIVLLEVKVDALTLNHHAQLLGYLVSAPLFKCGILVGVNVGRYSGSCLSDEYQQLLRMKALPMAFHISSSLSDVTFRTGVVYGQYQGMLNWWGSSEKDAIINFPGLCDCIEDI